MHEEEVVRETTQGVVRGDESMRRTAGPIGSSGSAWSTPSTWSTPLASWASIVAGTVALLAVSLLLTVLSLAIIAIVVHPTLTSLKGGAIAIWICAIVSTLIGAAVGGSVAGRAAWRTVSGSGAMHGFLAWALALVITFGFQAFAFRGMLTAAINTAVESSAVSFERSSATSDAATPGNAIGSLRPVQSTGDVTDPTGPSTGTGGGPTTGGPMGPGGRSEAAAVGRTALHYVAGYGWSWFGTWFFAGIIATAAAAAVGRRRLLTRSDVGESGRAERPSDRPTTTGPLTTAHTT